MPPRKPAPPRLFTLQSMPLAWLAAAWIAGVTSAALFGWTGWPNAVAAALPAAGVAVVRRDRALVLAAVAVPAIVLAATARYEATRPSLPADALARYNDRPLAVRFVAVVRDPPDIRDTSQRVVADVRAVRRGGDWDDASGGVLVTTRLYPRLREGDVIEIEGALESPANLERFDYADYLARRGIQSVLAFPQHRVVGHERPALQDRAVAAVRHRLSRSLDLALPEPHASLARGVLLGERSALPPSVSSDLNDTGTSHMVVVSGQNVVLVSAYATIFLAFWFGRRPGLWLSILAVLAYAAVVGFDPPVMRATIMGILLIVAQAHGRPSSSLTSLLVAAAVMTGLDPHVVRDVSFQLSFAATAGLIYLSSPLRDAAIAAIAWLLRRDAIPRLVAVVVAEPLAMTVAATVATSPIIALQFGRVSLVALPANMLVVPLFPFILGATALAALGGMLPAFRLAFAAPAFYLLDYWLLVARTLASIPGAVAGGSGFTPRWAVATYAVIAVGAFAVSRLHSRWSLAMRVAPLAFDLRALAHPALVAVPLSALVAGAGIAFWPHQRPPLEVTILDVGQGDAILIRTPAGYDVLVDGGPGAATLRALGDELPWRDRSIDLVVLTHPQDDHMLGLIDVLRRYDVRRVLAAGDGDPSSPAYAAWLDAVARERSPVERPDPGRIYDLGDSIVLEVLGPTAAVRADANANNRAVVLRLSWRDVSVLLTGDIEREAEASLLAASDDLRATVLKVAHHGGATSSTAPFLEAVQPRLSIVSAGRDNQFGHPRPEIVNRLRRYGPVYVTADQGDVTLTTDGATLWVETER